MYHSRRGSLSEVDRCPDHSADLHVPIGQVRHLFVTAGMTPSASDIRLKSPRRRWAHDLEARGNQRNHEVLILVIEVDRSLASDLMRAGGRHRFDQQNDALALLEILVQASQAATKMH